MEPQYIYRKVVSFYRHLCRLSLLLLFPFPYIVPGTFKTLAEFPDVERPIKNLRKHRGLEPAEQKVYHNRNHSQWLLKWMYLYLMQ